MIACLPGDEVAFRCCFLATEQDDRLADALANSEDFFGGQALGLVRSAEGEGDEAGRLDKPFRKFETFGKVSSEEKV